MGKRKYDDDSTIDNKKYKTDNLENISNSENDAEQPQNNQQSSKHGKSSLFDIKHFRKELSERQGQTMALTQFLQVCLNPDSDVDYMLEYLKVGGNSHEILRQITQDNKKNLTLATPVFHLFHLNILKVQSSLPHMISITEEACRYFLNTYTPTVEIMISENSGPRHRKIILNLLTSMVTLNSDLGIEVLNQIPLTPKNLQYILEKPNYKEKDNVRTAFVHFMTSFLVEGHLPLIKALLEKQGLLSLVIPGLTQDEPDAVLMFLNILKKNVIDNNLISKTLKLKTFNHQVLHNMFKVFMWKGPPELDSDKSEFKEDIMKLLSDIILLLFTSHKLGLYFVDPTLGTSDANKNQNLYKALQSLKRPWENEYQCEVVLEIIYKCPDLHRAIINCIEQSFQPQHTPMWDRTYKFVISLFDKLNPEVMITLLNNLNPQQTANFIRFVTMPVPLLKLMNAEIGKDQCISIYCVKILVKMLQSLKRFAQILELEDSNSKITDLKTKLDNFLPKHMPAPNIIVSLIKNCIENTESIEAAQDYRLPTPNNADALLSLIDVLLLYNYIYPASFESLEGTIDMKKILEFSTTLTTGRITLLKFKVVSLWLMLDSSALTIKNPIFKQLFLIMLEVFTSDEDETWIEAKDTLYIFFKNTEVFESDENEINLMLYTLRNSKVNPISLIGDIIEYVLQNGKELSEYVRNQVINFEISDENSKENVDNLFNDLMNGNITTESVFLETKIPSTFIVGCMQFIQCNRDAKKNLKQFLCLYVANLLHYNYSPELTEVLIGDSKLDIRSYVADWTVRPVCLPDIASKDDTLRNISKSIIEGEDIPPTAIFPFLLETAEESDLNVSIGYKFDVTKALNDSDLFVWAKYLMFCIIRLSNMSSLDEDQQKKIANYFEIIIISGKKRLMLNACRNIILNLFKNAHFLKVFQPVDFNKSTSNTLATKFLLQIVESNKDIINYLNKKHYILKSYQQKTYNEIAKAFVKVNKRKSINTDMSIKVLELIGLSKEDDLKVFDNIFSASTNACFKDDKEPTLVLQLLKILLDKYSKSIKQEICPDILKKSIVLYMKLLNLKDVTPNLTELEETLVKYFENKPHNVIHVSEEEYRKFFNANIVRKSTSNLAALLLKFNKKLCKIFIEEINKPEVLSQREITLPLGDAMINHEQFVGENKEVLFKIYEEYKSNITKFLEKPHKAGQVYIKSDNLIRKLITECMTVKDCKKIFAKNHKFEVVELSHVNLIQITFLKIFLDGPDKDYLNNYFLSILNIISIAIKENKEAEIVTDLVLKVNNVIKLIKSMDTLQRDKTEDYKKITESAIWQSFCKSVLKDSLRIKTADQENITGPRLLALLSSMITLFYPTDHEDIVNIFDMVTSHSEFLNVMLSLHSPEIKSRLLEFLYVLISINKSVMKTQQIPVYLSAYRATRSRCDRLILSILQYYESNNLPVNEYKPYIFGESAANHYAVRKKRTSSLWSHPTPNQVMNLFEKEIIENTIKHFPVNQTLDYYYELPNIDSNSFTLKENLIRITRDIKSKSKDTETAIANLLTKTEHNEIIAKAKEHDIISVSHTEEDETIYDPAFLFPLLSHILAPGSVASCFKMLRTGLLSVPVMGLSSHCPLMRAAAYHVLHRFCMLLETETRHKNDKLLLKDFITTLRRSLSTAVNTANSDGELKDMKNPKLPAIGALYLSRALMISTSPSDPLYKPVNNFLIAKQIVDLTVVPDFLSLFHDSDIEAIDRRLWILDIIKNGTKTMTDVNVIFKTMCLKMIMDYYSTVLSDRKTKVKIINALSSMIAIPRAFEILIEGYGFISWLHFVVRNIGRDDRSIVKAIHSLIRNLLQSMEISLFVKHAKFNTNSSLDTLQDFKLKSDLEYEVLSIVYDLLPHTDMLETDDIICYVNLYNLITKRSIKFLTKRQIINVVTKCTTRRQSDECVNIIHQAVVSNNSVLLFSKSLLSVPKDRLLNELRDLVQTYL